MDGQTGKRKLTITFCNFANMPENEWRKYKIKLVSHQNSKKAVSWMDRTNPAPT
jgi:hypothetical protein